MKLLEFHFVLPVLYKSLSIEQKRQVRERYIFIQKGKCYWCKCDIHSEPPESITNKSINLNNFPNGFLNSPIHLQHNHKTGMTEGAVHAYCNAVMWEYHNR